MDITLTIKADSSALEFARLLSSVKLTAEPKAETKAEPKAETKVSLTIEDCRAKAKEVLSTDPEKFKKALIHFGIGCVADLKPEDFQGFMEFLG